MSGESRVQLERQQYELLAQIVGEAPTVEKLSSVQLLHESVRLLGILADNGIGNGGSGGSSFAEDYGPESERPASPATGTQFFNTDTMKLEVWNGSAWAPVDTVGTPFAEAFGTTAQRPASRPVGFQFFDTTLGQLVVWNGSAWVSAASGEDATARAGVSRLVTRQALAHTTASLAPGASETFTLTVPRSFTLLTLGVSAQARVRAYGTTAARTADEARAFGSDPTDAVYPALDLDSVLPHKGSLSAKVNADFSPNAQGEWFMRVTNTGSSAAAVTLTIAILPREAVS